ncbi:glycoside hydrolase [Polychytrium aggregatum]|uniref:glycoside hydrolase n=1 Tax=Polychytrium aggregatum TaxID=110093 RepID=UPI0022FEA2E2|nr:glycoside hydrolase [Polychytrium aggregatum]KAI9206089.1 glycoside hydrolase [Polychytrium aggregatum]
MAKKNAAATPKDPPAPSKTAPAEPVDGDETMNAALPKSIAVPPQNRQAPNPFDSITEGQVKLFTTILAVLIAVALYVNRKYWIYQYQTVKFYYQHYSAALNLTDVPTYLSLYPQYSIRNFKQYARVNMETIWYSYTGVSSDAFLDLNDYTDAQNDERRREIIGAFKHAWKGYETYAFGHDELCPVTKTHKDSLGGFGVTIVDSLDTMLLMSNEDTEVARYYERALEFIEQKLDYNRDYSASLFEFTTRHLGGLLSAYHLSGTHPKNGGKKDEALLQKATDLGTRLLKAFNTPTLIPVHSVHLQKGLPYQSNPHSLYGDLSILSELGSVQLEFLQLTLDTGNHDFAKTSQNVINRLYVVASNRYKGLVPVFINNQDGAFSKERVEFTFGPMADSFYETLLKQYLITGYAPAQKISVPPPTNLEPWANRLLQMYANSTSGLKSLLKTSFPAAQTFITSVEGKNVVDLFHHLHCYVPGMLALGAFTSVVPQQRSATEEGDEDFSFRDYMDSLDEDVDMAASAQARAETQLHMASRLMDTCWNMYENSPLGLGPEQILFNSHKLPYLARKEGVKSFPYGWADYQAIDDSYKLRPEVAESLYIMHRLTGNPVYRERAWALFQSLQKHCKTPHGYSGIRSTSDSEDLRKELDPDELAAFEVAGTKQYLDDHMPSWLLSQTLKYLYLIFRDGGIQGPHERWGGLTDTVFTTGGHLLKVIGRS